MTPTAAVAQLTANFAVLQGLRLVPGGLIAIVYPVGMLLLPTSLWVPLAIAALGAMGIAVDLYYRRSFGIVHGLPAHVRRQTAYRLTAYGVLVVAAWVDLIQHWPVLMMAPAAACLTVVHWAVSGRGRAYWPVIAALLLALTPLPALGVTAPGLPTVAAFAVAFGVAQIVGGVLDHRYLVTRMAAVHV